MNDLERAELDFIRNPSDATWEARRRERQRFELEVSRAVRRYNAWWLGEFFLCFFLGCFHAALGLLVVLALQALL